MVECCAAAALLAATLAIVVSLLSAVLRQRNAASLHAKALIAADNLLERITSEPYESMTAESVAEFGSASNVAEMLPDGVVEIKVSEESGSPSGKRIEVEIAWRTTGAQPSSRHRVATWVYRAEGKR